MNRSTIPHRNARRRGTSLLEVILATALLGGGMASTLTLVARHDARVRRADERVVLHGFAERILERYSSRLENGTIPRSVAGYRDVFDGWDMSEHPRVRGRVRVRRYPGRPGLWIVLADTWIARPVRGGDDTVRLVAYHRGP